MGTMDNIFIVVTKQDILRYTLCYNALHSCLALEIPAAPRRTCQTVEPDAGSSELLENLSCCRPPVVESSNNSEVGEN